MTEIPFYAFFEVITLWISFLTTFPEFSIQFYTLLDRGLCTELQIIGGKLLYLYLIRQPCSPTSDSFCEKAQIHTLQPFSQPF